MWGVTKQKQEDHERRLMAAEKQNEILRETIVKSSDLLREALNQHISNRSIHTDAETLRDFRSEVNGSLDKLEGKIDKLEGKIDQLRR